jgi:cytochrome c biogenesis protein CcdA
MFSKVEKNYLINIMLVIVGFACIFTGIGLAFKPGFLMPILIAIKIKSLHEWTGYILTVLLGWHILMHSDWIKFMTSNMFSNKKKITATVVTMLIAIVVCISISTMSPDQKMPNDNNGNHSHTKNIQ